MSKHGPIIEELEREQTNILALWNALGHRQLRVARHPPGGTTVDHTTEFADGLRMASDALNKAVAALKNVDA
jgi:hypothetical protein